MVILFLKIIIVSNRLTIVLARYLCLPHNLIIPQDLERNSQTLVAGVIETQNCIQNLYLYILFTMISQNNYVFTFFLVSINYTMFPLYEYKQIHVI